MNKKFPDVSPSKGNLVKTFLQNLKISTTKTSSAIRWRKSFFVVQLLTASILVFSGCKDPDDLGLDALPPGDQLQTVFSDTSTIINQVIAEDTLQTDELSYQLLGCINDATFGLSTASIYAQVNLAGTPAFGTAPVADSMILILTYNSYYGDTSEQQTVNVYHLTDDMYVDSTYYSFSTFGEDPTPIGSATFSPRPLSSVVVGTDTLAPQVRIALDLTLANQMLTQSATTLSSNADWLAYFKGIHIAAQPTATLGKGSIGSFNFFSSAVALYFHDGTESKKYLFSMVNARVNTFTHDFTGTPVGTAISSGTTDSLAYVQGNAGVKTKISFPFLKHFVDSGSIVVNKAELKITAQGNVPPLYPVATRLLLTTKSDAGANVFPIDYYESTGYFGGDYNTSTNTYTFNIARQVQGIMDGTYNSTDFYLVVAGAGILSNRVVIGSSSNSDYKMKFSVYYTKIN